MELSLETAPYDSCNYGKVVEAPPCATFSCVGELAVAVNSIVVQLDSEPESQ